MQGLQLTGRAGCLAFVTSSRGRPAEGFKSPPSRSNQNRTIMKDRAEKMAQRAIMQLTDVATRYIEDVGQVLTEMESTHDDMELMKSMEYQTLLAGWSGLQQMMEWMNKQLNNVK